MLGTLLIVDDIEGVHEMLELVFQNLDVQLKHAHSANDALRIYREEPVDVVLCDIKMPRISGLELVGLLRETDPQAVIILMAASCTQEQLIQAMRLGVYDFAAKPYQEQELCEMVKRAMKHRQRQLALSEAANRLAAVKRELAELHRWKEKHSSNENEEALQSLLQREQELQKREMELEVKEGALQTMESVLKERLQSIKRIQHSRPAVTAQGMNPEVQSQLEKLKMELEARKQALEEMEASLNEREAFLQQSEETLFAKGQSLQELETELEQLREDLNRQKAAGSAPAVQAGQVVVDQERLKELEAMKQNLLEREEAVAAQEQALKKREMALRKAELLLRAREQFLEQSESILFGDESKE